MEILSGERLEESAMCLSPAELIEQHGESVYRLCCSLTRSKEDADDLFQDTFLKAFEQGFDRSSLLFSTAVYIWKSRKRKFARRHRIAPTIPIDDVQVSGGVLEEDVIRDDEFRIVRELVADLPEKIRIPITLYYTVELSIAEIAETLGIPEGTVKSRLHKGRKIIEEGLRKHEYKKRY